MSFFITRDAHLAALLRYELPDSHVDTAIEHDGNSRFEFAKSASCDTILREFYRKPNDEFGGYLVTDARRLLKEAHQIRKAVMNARDRRRKDATNEQ